MAIESTFIATNLHNTADALNFLSQAAENASHLPENRAGENSIHSHYVSSSNNVSLPNNISSSSHVSSLNHVAQPAGQSMPTEQYTNHGVLPYHLVTSGLLTGAQVAELLSRLV